MVICDYDQAGHTRQYWLTKTPRERLAACLEG
jgi:hypothetical protein